MIKWLKLLLIIGFSTSLYALNVEQINKIKVTYEIGKSIKAKDGMSFENTLPSIMGQESSWGVFVLGDKWDKNGRLKSVYLSSLGNFQIKLNTAKLTIKKYPKLFNKYKKLIYDGKSIYIKYEEHKKQYDKYKKIITAGYDKFIDTKEEEIRNSKNFIKMEYYKHILNSPVWIKRFNNKETKAIRTFKWAKKELAYHKNIHRRMLSKFKNNTAKEYQEINTKYIYHMQEYMKLKSKAEKDMRLINKLLTDFEFGAEIGGYYLLSLYEEAVSRGFKNPYQKAVGRYNGGWNNTTYFNLVKNKMKTVKKIMKG